MRRPQGAQLCIPLHPVPKGKRPWLTALLITTPWAAQQIHRFYFPASCKIMQTSQRHPPVGTRNTSLSCYYKACPPTAALPFQSIARKVACSPAWHGMWLSPPGLHTLSAMWLPCFTFPGFETLSFQQSAKEIIKTISAITPWQKSAEDAQLRVVISYLKEAT